MDGNNGEPELPKCNFCDVTLKPERIGADRYVCGSCGRVFNGRPVKA